MVQNSLLMGWFVIQVIGCVTDGLNNELIVRNSGHGLNNENITQVELSPLIRPSIRPRIIPNYRVFSNSKAGSSYSPKFIANK